MLRRSIVTWKVSDMKTAFLVAAAGVIFGSGVLAPAFADGPKASGGSTWPGMAQRPEAPLALTPPPVGLHWVWQNTYNDRYEPTGRWVLFRQ